jgi:hypothetical protein
MNDSNITLLLNMGVLAMLITFSVWFSGYIMRWWLRNQRTNTIIKDWYEKMAYLEIKLPREIHKSPAAMEVLLNSLHQPSGHNPDSYLFKKRDKKKDSARKHRTEMRKKFYDTYIKGKIRFWSSLEIVSEEGQIRYFVVTQKKFVDIFKSYAYSQYPGIEVNEVEDYAEKYNYTDNKVGDTQIYATRWKLGSEDCLPIKTYVDYGLDKDPKEEYKIDPLTTLLEIFAAAGPGETFVYQIIFRPTLFEKEWREETTKKMKSLLQGEKKEGENKPETRQVSNLFPHEKEMLEVLQRNIEKPGFDVLIRSYYIAHNKDKFSSSKGTLGVLNSMKTFGKPGYNTFSPATIHPYDDYPFTDPKGMQTEGKRKYIWWQFKLRTGFNYEADGGELAWKKFFHKWFVAKNFDWAMDHIDEMKEYLSPGHTRHKAEAGEFILNSEELATIWHFPGTTFGNTSARVQSVKSEAPRNLPI